MIAWSFKKWLVNAAWCAGAAILFLVFASIIAERTMRASMDNALQEQDVWAHRTWSFGSVGPIAIVIIGMGMWGLIATSVVFAVLGCIRFSHELAVARQTGRTPPG